MDFITLLVIIVILFMAYVLIIFNKLIKAKLRVKQAKSGIDVYLQQRFDLIPNLVECVKQYSEYENKTLTKLAELRASYVQNKELELGKEINNKLNNVMAVIEQYPELKANEQFLVLQKSLTKMENQLQAARRLYNIEVTVINRIIQTFPSNIIASIFGFKPEILFELEDNEAAQNVKVDINTEKKE